MCLEQSSVAVPKLMQIGSGVLKIWTVKRSGRDFGATLYVGNFAPI